MKNLELYNVSELDQKELVNTEGGLAFIVGCIVGVVIGAACVSAGYYIAKAINE